MLVNTLRWVKFLVYLIQSALRGINRLIKKVTSLFSPHHYCLKSSKQFIFDWLTRAMKVTEAKSQIEHRV